MLARRSFLASLLAGSVANLSGSVAKLCASSESFTIGISESIIHGQMKPDTAQVVFQSMSGIFEVQGRPKPQIQFRSSSELATQLQNHAIHLSIVTGIEYGWLNGEYPKLLPLVTAFVSGIRLKACILVPSDSSTSAIRDLRGKSIVLPQRLQFHTLLYLQQVIREGSGDPHEFFGRTIGGVDSAEGIETVVEKKADAILIDEESWRCYQERQPGRGKKLKKIDESQAFPTAAILYHPPAWQAGELALLKNAMCGAHEKPFTRQILNFWRISKFVPYSTDYQNVVNNILREIPKPMQPVSFGVKK